MKFIKKFTNEIFSIVILTLFLALSACGAAPSSSSSNSASSGSGSGTTASSANNQRLADMENQLLVLINQERVDNGLPELKRVSGLDLIMLWYGFDMVIDQHIGHIDVNNRSSNERVNYYSNRTDVRCSEITAWFGGASADSHYNGYKSSPGHHSAYMEEGLFNLGPTTHVGVIVLEGTGPVGTSFEGRSGTYSGLVFCDVSPDVVIDPFGGSATLSTLIDSANDYDEVVDENEYEEEYEEDYEDEKEFEDEETDEEGLVGEDYFEEEELDDELI